MALTRTDSLAGTAAAAFLCLLAGESALFGHDGFDPALPAVCDTCDERSAPLEPIRLSGAAHYAGTAERSAVPVAFDDADAYGAFAYSSPAVLERTIAAEHRAAAALAMNMEMENPERENR